jgi:hypothetical protein
VPTAMRPSRLAEWRCGHASPQLKTFADRRVVLKACQDEAV